MLKPLYFAFLFVICLSCSQTDSIDISNDMEIDLNEDGTPDFHLIYEDLSVVEPIAIVKEPYGLVRILLQPYNNNQLLRSVDTRSILFLNNREQVQDQVNLPLFWGYDENKNANILASISQDSEGESWPDKWTIINDETKPSYTIGFKLSNLSSSNIGVMEFSIDDVTGEIEVLNVEFY